MSSWQLILARIWLFETEINFTLTPFPFLAVCCSEHFQAARNKLVLQFLQRQEEEGSSDQAAAWVRKWTQSNFVPCLPYLGENSLSFILMWASGKGYCNFERAEFVHKRGLSGSHLNIVLILELCMMGDTFGSFCYFISNVICFAIRAVSSFLYISLYACLSVKEALLLCNNQDHFLFKVFLYVYIKVFYKVCSKFNYNLRYLWCQVSGLMLFISETISLENL